MGVGILVLAMLSGAAAAVAALVAGYSLLTALAIYAGCGSLSVLLIASRIIVGSALRDLQVIRST
ncbi:MAG: hypothetical protein COB37_07540 [Kordiimonadales bacterium]|nr:MAG: hypothetical protein COB37_07540 [Kordiimonadales bacterium]